MKTIQNHLKNPSLSKLLNRASILAHANRQLQDLLPQALRPHCVLANFDEHQILIATASAVYISPLMAMQAWLHQNLKAFHPLKQTQKIHFTVMPSLCQSSAPSRNAPILSNQTKMLIDQTAKRIKNAKLKQALARLSHQETGTSTGTGS